MRPAGAGRQYGGFMARKISAAPASANDSYAFHYYPHNIHFLWAARLMQGRSHDALQAALQRRASATVR